jgi:hypothetical protein
MMKSVFHPQHFSLVLTLPFDLPVRAMLQAKRRLTAKFFYFVAGSKLRLQ